MSPRNPTSSQDSPTPPLPGGDIPGAGAGAGAGYALLQQRLNDFGRFRKRWAWFHALAWLVMLGPGVAFLWVLADAAHPMPWWLLLPTCAAVLGVNLYALAAYVVPPLLRKVRVEREALVIESLHGELDNQIIGSLQLGQEAAKAAAEGKTTGYSMALVDALVARTARNVGQLKLTSLVDLRRAKRDMQISAWIMLAVATLCVAEPGLIMTRVARVQDAYATLLDLLYPVDMKAGPGDLCLVRGKPVTLKLEALGARRPGALLIRTDLKTHQVRTDALTLSSGVATWPIEAVGESFAYQFEYAGRRTPEHKILVGDLPAVAAMNTELAYPLYTGMPPRTLVGRLPKLQALSGTGVLVSIASTVDLSSQSFVQWGDGSIQPLSVSGRFAHFSFTVENPERISIHLTGALGKGFEMPEPIGMEIGVQRDMPPTVEVLLRNKKLTMLADEASRFGVTAVAEDDFGVAEVLLDYKIDTIDPLLGRPVRQGTVSRLVEPAKDHVKVSFTDVFKTLTPALEPGDRITINVSARDNNTQTGPGVGRAAPIEIVVVRPDLGAYVEQQFGFGSDPLLGGLRKVQRATNLLIEAEKTAKTEVKAPIEKLDVKSRAGAEAWPQGSQDAVGDYFRLLSGEKQ